MRRNRSWPGQALLAIFAAVMMLMSLAAGEAPEASSAYVEVTPAPDRTFRMEVVRITASPAMADKRILIYHTHTWEAYTQVEDAPYVPTEKWRTKDNNANVVAVGRALAANLTAMGYTVVHDETAFEPPDLTGAYQRSLAMLEKRQERGETYDLYIDLHRDAFDDPNAIRQTVSIGGQDVARFMMLIGKGTGQTGAGYDVKPDWQANHVIAEKLTASLNRQCDQLCRDIKVKTGRFNQHVAKACVLIECGNNHNTLEEVLRGVPYLAQAIHDTLQ